MNKVKGFKATDKEGKCRGVQFRVGETYVQSGPTKLCENGYHFCTNLFDVYNYYDKSSETRLFEIEALSPITEGDKSCSTQITILRELTDLEKLQAWIKRTNSGDYNSGDYNSGDYNSGNRNSGYYNSGDYNSGDYNSGNYNSGNYNSGNYNSGYFNTQTPFVKLFNKTTKLKWDDPIIAKLNSLNVKPILRRVFESDMTEEQKTQYPSYKTTGGFLLNIGRQDWSKLSKEELEFIKSLPNFDAEIFKHISGIDLSEGK
jgi:hypothetical protein